jgi:prepilin-type processing-associated H-X9-DG protein
MVQILPYIEQPNVFEHFDFSVGVYDPKNDPPRAVIIPVYQCPSNPVSLARGGTTYAGCHHDVEAPIDVDNRGVLFLNSSIRYRDIRDGSSNTVFVGEHNGDMLGWASGTRATLRNTGTAIGASTRASIGAGLGTGAAGSDAEVLAVGGFSSSHNGGAQFLFGDGAVRFVSQGITPNAFRQFGDRSDGELSEYGF